MLRWPPCIVPRIEPTSRCLYRVHLHYRVQPLGQVRRHQEQSRNPTLVDRPLVGLVTTPWGRFLHISHREYSDFWTFPTSRSVLRCARSGVRVNLSTMVNYSPPPRGFVDDNRTVWFRRYRKENFHDESLPPGKWSRRESKQNWVCRARYSSRLTHWLHYPENLIYPVDSDARIGWLRVHNF